MPFLAPLVPALIGAGGAIGSSLISGAAGAANRRPPSLDPTQRGALDQLIPSLMGQVQGAPRIDPVQQALLYGQNAQSLTGANNAVTHALVSRGLGHSGILGTALMQNQNQSQANQNQINLGLQQQAVQQRQLNINDIIQLLGVGNIPGQSAGGGFLAGMAPILAYSIQNALNNRSGGGGQFGPFGTSGLPTGTAPLNNPFATPPFIATPNSP